VTLHKKFERRIIESVVEKPEPNRWADLKRDRETSIEVAF